MHYLSVTAKFNQYSFLDKYISYGLAIKNDQFFLVGPPAYCRKLY